MLSFRSPFSDFTPEAFPLFGPILIAPFWDDINIGQGGSIFFRFSDDEQLLVVVEMLIREAFGSDFSPAMLFIATWDRVPEFGGFSDVVSAVAIHH